MNKILRDEDTEGTLIGIMCRKLEFYHLHKFSHFIENNEYYIIVSPQKLLFVLMLYFTLFLLLLLFFVLYGPNLGLCTCQENIVDIELSL